jgi:Asp-tRNA(Asn)/Glu-tRNA(Gln) amidotransferase A subunit family amidase
MTDLADLTVSEAAAMMGAGTLTSADLTRAVLSRLADTEPLVHAYARVSEAALDAARVADELRRGGGQWSPLLGIPIAVKDVLHTKDLPTEAGSQVLAGFRPRTDATSVARLRSAGAVVIGKTVTHEFAYGMNVPPTRNPWRLDSYPGGSSAGSAAAVSVGSAMAALGTDTAGSVRTPASVTGVVGLKPTYGRVSLHGVIPASPSMDHVGVITRSVADSSLMLDAIAGHDPRDPSSLREPLASWPIPDAARDITGMRLGIERDYFLESPHVADGVRRVSEDAMRVLADLGAEIIDVSIPQLDWSTVVGNTIMAVDYSAWHRESLRQKPDYYHPGTRRMLLLGLVVPAVVYAQAHRVRRRIVEAIHDAFRVHRLDALIAPTIPVTAPTIDEMSRPDGGVDLSGLVHHNFPANLAGLPALSVPCGFAEGLPVGLQFTGRPLDEARILTLGHAYEAATRWCRRPVRPVHAEGSSHAQA